ncbi:MAG TPA: hypothetical protein VNE62_02260 [Actinomycetota bacterium]|nr:hypothetical protein [Actinomycetota bacterium]
MWIWLALVGAVAAALLGLRLGGLYVLLVLPAVLMVVALFAGWKSRRAPGGIVKPPSADR